MGVIHAFEVLVLVLSFLFALGCRALVRRAYAAYRRAAWARKQANRGTIREEFEEMMAARSAHLHRAPVTRSSH